MKKNLLANYAGTVFAAGAQVLLIPIYVRTLGETHWGMLSAVIALSGALLAFEAGVSLSVSRSFSGSRSTHGNALERFRLLEKWYLGAALAALIGGAVASTMLSRWMWSASDNQHAYVVAAAMGMAGAQIAGGLYRSVLIGTGDQVALNGLLITFTSVRHAAGVTAAAVSQDVLPVVVAFALSSALETAGRRWRAAHALRMRQAKDTNDRGNLENVPEALAPGALAVAGAVGALSTQVDRILLINVVEVTALGHYAIATTLSLAALQLIYPLSSALIPRISHFQREAKANATLKQTYAVLVVVLVLVWVGAVCLSLGGLRLWLGDESIASSVTPLFLIHLLGTTLNALCIPQYMRLLSDRRDRAIAVAALLAVIVQLITLWLSGDSLLTLAGSLSWCAANGTLFICYYAFHFLGRRHDTAKPS